MPAKTIFVTGATGNQGGATVRHLLKNGFHVKGLTRNASSAKAKELKNLNVEVIEGDLDKPASYAQHLKNVDGVFAIVVFTHGVQKEIQQGVDLANAAREHGVNHFLYSSVGGADAGSGIPHWESKFKVENYIKQIDVPFTIVRPASLYENFLFPQVKSRLLKGKLVVPLDKTTLQQIISTEDIGRISTIIFSNPEKYLTKTIGLAAEEMTQGQMAEIFSKVWNKEVRFQKLPGLITRLAMGKGLHKMFKWVNTEKGHFIDQSFCEKEFGPMLKLEEWIRSYFK